MSRISTVQVCSNTNQYRVWSLSQTGPPCNEFIHWQHHQSNGKCITMFANYPKSPATYKHILARETPIHSCIKDVETQCFIGTSLVGSKATVRLTPYISSWDILNASFFGHCAPPVDQVPWFPTLEGRFNKYYVIYILAFTNFVVPILLSESCKTSFAYFKTKFRAVEGYSLREMDGKPV